jgi:hypothetical protein
MRGTLPPHPRRPEQTSNITSRGALKAGSKPHIRVRRREKGDEDVEEYNGRGNIPEIIKGLTSGA